MEELPSLSTSAPQLWTLPRTGACFYAVDNYRRRRGGKRAKQSVDRRTDRPNDPRTETDGDDIACPQDEERRRYDGLRSGGTGRMLSGVRNE